MARYLQQTGPRINKKQVMGKFLKILLLIPLLAVFSGGSARTQTSDGVFVPIAKYMGNGDAESLSAWFSDQLEITIDDLRSDSSRNQGRQILKNFFSNNPPQSFTIEHTASRGNVKDALGVLKCRDDSFLVTIFVCRKKDSFKIQQLKIEKSQ